MFLVKSYVVPCSWMHVADEEKTVLLCQLVLPHRIARPRSARRKMNVRGYGALVQAITEMEDRILENAGHWVTETRPSNHHELNSHRG